MIPPSVVPASPRSFAFPALVPIAKIPAQPPLTPDVLSINLPVVPPIPPVVNTGDVITAAHENTVTTSLSDLWTDLQAINAAMLTDPTTTQGDLIVRGTSGLSRLGAGGTSGSVLTLDMAQPPLLMAWKPLNAASIGAVPTTRQVLAGAGMTGGGPLSADVTLNANVTSVFGRTGAVVLTAADISAGGGVPATRSIIAGTGLTGGGALTADVTLNARAMGASGASHAAGSVPDPGSTAGATRYLREDATWAVPAGGGGGLTDPTTTLGDLIVRGSAAVTRLGVGTNGQVLTADSTQTLGVKWATPTGGGGSQTPWTSNHDAAGYSLSGVTTINAGTVNVGAFTLTGNANGLIRSTFINVNTGASARMDIQIGANWGGAGSNMYIGCANSAYGAGETQYIDCQAGKLLVNANAVDFSGTVGVGLMNSPVKMFVAGVDQAPGTGLGSFIVSAPATNMQLRMGYSQSGAYGWISASDSSVFTPLVLQGAGGMTGIGTVPNSRLTVYGTAVGPTNTGGVFPALIGIMGDTQVQMDLGAFPANPYGAYIQVRHVSASGLAWPLALNPLGGNVGIGTSTPAGPLHVAAKGSIFGTAAGAVSSPAATDANLMVYNNSAASWAGIGAATDGSMWFRVGTSGAPSAFMVISPNQGMGLGGIAAPGYQLQLSLDSAAKPGTNTWTVASDRRLKRNIRPFTEGLETLLQLKPTAFTYNGEADMPDGMEGVGLIAQEAAEVIPTCVRHARGLIAGEETEVLALNTSDLQWMIINALSQIDQRLRRAEL